MVGGLTVTQAIAALLYVASLEIPFPEFWRHTLARRHLMIVLRTPM